MYQRRKKFCLSFFEDRSRNDKLFGDLTSDEEYFEFFRATLHKFHGIPSREKAARWMQLLMTPVIEDE